MILRKLRMNQNGVQCFGFQGRYRPTGNRLRIEYAVAEHPQPSRRLGNQHALAIGQKRDVPGAVQPGGKLDNADSMKCSGRASAVRLSVGGTRARRVSVENHGRAVFTGWSLLGGSEN